MSNTTAPPLAGLFWLALAVTFGIRRPGGALLAGLAFGASTAVFRWLSTDLLPGGDVNALITSIYFVPILSGIGAIQLAQEPDGVLALTGQQRLRKRREKARLARIAEAEAAAHGGTVPEHERVHTATKAAAAPVVDTPLEATLAVRGVVAGYGDAEVLHGVDLDVEAGRITALLGANGAGKSTLCLVAAGAVDATLGKVFFEGQDITEQSTFERARDGLLLVPEARGIFPGLTVEENLTISLRDEELRAAAFERFPILLERRQQVAGLLSGGEQQMLSLAPMLADPPAVLVADEPTLGLAPLAADAVMQAIVEIRDRGCAVLLVEEHAQNALAVADTLVFLELGAVVWQGPRDEADLEVLTGAYLGGGR
jgi:ABC-type branched-subunit amino acid transport system ATPase component